MSAPAADARVNRDSSGDAADGVQLKVCGITERAELDALAENSVDLVGLWHGVPGGPADLELDAWRALAAAAGDTGTVAPVLVTFMKDAEALAAALGGSDVTWVQLHGYQMPGVVRKLKELVPGVKVLKVLHVRGGECVEEPLLASYEKAGVDVFLLDAVAEDGRVGSTGESLDPAYAVSLAERFTKPFLLAGGISSENRGDFGPVTQHPRFLGVDVDTNARGTDGRIASDRVAAISRAWKAEG